MGQEVNRVDLLGPYIDAETCLTCEFTPDPLQEIGVQVADSKTDDLQSSKNTHTEPVDDTTKIAYFMKRGNLLPYLTHYLNIQIPQLQKHEEKRNTILG